MSSYDRDKIHRQDTSDREEVIDRRFVTGDTSVDPRTTRLKCLKHLDPLTRAALAEAAFKQRRQEALAEQRKADARIAHARALIESGHLECLPDEVVRNMMKTRDPSVPLNLGSLGDFYSQRK